MKYLTDIANQLDKELPAIPDKGEYKNGMPLYK